MRRSLIAALVLALLALLVPTGTSLAKPVKAKPQKAEASERGRNETSDRRRPISRPRSGQGRPGGEQARPTPRPPRRGRTWLGLDDVLGGFYAKNYKLRGIGEHIEVWTARGNASVGGIQSSNLNFQAGDCRNGERTVVTDAQVEYLIDQFDNNIFPIESELYSVPPERDGTDATAEEEALGVKPGYYSGDGDDIVVLIDNVRDDNFYDLNNTQEFSYIAGFFSSG